MNLNDLRAGQELDFTLKDGKTLHGWYIGRGQFQSDDTDDWVYMSYQVTSWQHRAAVDSTEVQK